MQDEKLVAIKGDISESLRVRFKKTCVEHRVTISDTLATLIEKWVEEKEGKESSGNINPGELFFQNTFTIPESLRVRFNKTCAERKVIMSDILKILIKDWINKDDRESLMSPEGRNSADTLLAMFLNMLLSEEISEVTRCMNPSFINDIATYIAVTQNSEKSFSEESLHWLVQLILIIKKRELTNSPRRASRRGNKKAI